MHRKTLTPQLLVLATVCVVAVAISSAVSQHTSGMNRTYQLANMKYLSLGELTVMIDTRTGQMWRLRGGTSATQTGNSWASRVPAVKGSHSGMLDFTQMRAGSADGVFLSDVNGDRTWLLKWRGNETGEWFEVKTE